MREPYAIVEVRSTDLPGGHAREWCRQCSCVEGYLARYIQINGTVAVRWICNWCEDYGTASDLPQDWVALFGVAVDDLPVRIDRYDPEWGGLPKPPCVVCGETSACRHHWAPLSIFPDWPWDLMADLCQEHHDEWHARMREHGLRWPHELEGRDVA